MSRRSPRNRKGQDARALIAESDRLRPLFLAWCGKRTRAAALSEVGIEYLHGQGWLAGRHSLNAQAQQALRVALDQAGVAQSPCA